MKNLFLAFLLFVLGGVSVYAQTSAVFYQSLAWSPDGKYLTLTGMYDMNQKEKTMKADIYTMRTDGSDFKKITGDERNEFYSAWAKGIIVFGAGTVGTRESDIYTANWDGSNLTQVTKNAGRNATPDISPDGKKIAFISNRDGEKMQIYVMNADGSNQTLLTNNIGHNIFPAFSPDGKKIIFSSSRRETKADSSYVEGSYVYVMNADGSNLTKLANINSYFARFSPDGKKIAYIAGKFPETAVYIANADGSGTMKITK